MFSFYRVKISLQSSASTQNEWIGHCEHRTRLLKRPDLPHERWKSSERQKFLSVWNDRLTLFVHLSFKCVEHEKGRFYPGVWIKGGKVWESGAHHWFLPAISKSVFHPAFMCLRGRIGLESVQIPAFPQPATPPWCAWNKQLFYHYFQEVQIPYYHMANAHRAAKQGSIFQEKRQFRCSANASQPFSQSVSQSVNQFGKECQGPCVGTPLHITSYDVWCFDMQNLNQAPTLRDGSK